MKIPQLIRCNPVKTGIVRPFEQIINGGAGLFRLVFGASLLTLAVLNEKPLYNNRLRDAAASLGVQSDMMRFVYPFNKVKKRI